MGGKFDLSVQDKVEDFINGWAVSAKKYRPIAIIVLLAAIALTVLISVFSPYKYFPKSPSTEQIQLYTLRQSINDFHKKQLFRTI